MYLLKISFAVRIFQVEKTGSSIIFDTFALFPDTTHWQEKTCFIKAKSSPYYRKGAFSVQTIFYACVGRDNLPHPHFRHEWLWKVVENIVTNNLQKSIFFNQQLLLKKQNLARVQDGRFGLRLRRHQIAH